MPRCIDADALMAQLNRKKAGPCNERYTEGFNDALMRFRSMIHSAPTVSPDEVRGKGEWIDKCVRAWSCSCCGTPLNHIRQFAVFVESELPKYCPNCGARMKGVSEDA